MTSQTSPFILLGIGVLASVAYFYAGPKLFGSKGAKLTESPFMPFPPVAQAVTSQGPPLPAVLPQGQPPMGPQTILPPPMPPVNNSPNITLQNGSIPMSPMGMPEGNMGLPPNLNPQGAMMPPAYPPMKPNQNMMFSGATFPENVPGLTYGFPMTGF